VTDCATCTGTAGQCTECDVGMFLTEGSPDTCSAVGNK
jgi:hypothetical protein